jgi:phosphoglycolate phosphatase-like HAD superfamily hydrolase
MKCIIFDLDGTLCDDTHRAHHMHAGDWDTYFARCIDDPPFEGVMFVARAVAGHCRVVFITGRSESVKKETCDWLDAQGFRSYALYMRPVGDFRANSVIKLEALASVRAAGYVPLLVFEDQPQTCKMWRSAGVPVAQVGGKVDFVEHTRT